MLALALLADLGPARQTTFPGNNGLLAYTLSPHLWVVSPDGTGARAVTSGLPVRAWEPAWAPDRQQLAFVNTIVANGGIWVVRTDGTGARRVTTLSTDSSPTWSPDGRRIAFARQPVGDRFVRLLVVNADGSGLTVLTPSFDIHVADPEWSPDGSRIAFTNGGNVYIVNADGSQPRLLTAARGVTWAPDGTRLAVQSLGAISVINADGTGLRQIASGFRELWETSWSPDGTKIAFVNDPAGPFQEELYVMNADGSGVTRLNVDTETTVDWGSATAAPPPPEAGKTANVAPVSGVVTVRVRGTTKFVPLTELTQIPVGSELDATRGRVRMTVAAGGGRTEKGDFYQGQFLLKQAAGRRPLTTLRLSAPIACPGPGRLSELEQTARRRKRRVWGSAKGRFQTRGRYSSASVRGTTWLTEDRCNGTLVRVRAGRVEVFDFVRRRRVRLRAGQSYFARAR
jgi:hypothetical protein